MAKPAVLVINGPNLNLLGTREPGIYGSATLKDVEDRLKSLGQELNCDVDCFQSNYEGAIVDKIQQSRDVSNFILINAGALTHTSVAVRDALLSVSVPFFEVHISNVHAREEFRHHSYLSDKAVGVIAGFGIEGYEYALRKAVLLAEASSQRDA